MQSLDRGMFAVLAVLWVLLAVASERTPWPHPFWIVLAGAAAGTAAAVAVYWSRTALRAYLGAVVVFAALRSIAYAMIGATSPAAVWSILLASSALVYAIVSERMP